jgi:hypothetical protein
MPMAGLPVPLVFLSSEANRSEKQMLRPENKEKVLSNVPSHAKT